MEDEETKPCPNCKREIPAVNFTIHSVHCARNIKICPVCKEPVPSADLEEHHNLLHKLLPCKQCGELVCGTDLEDHIRDSCAITVKTCRYCELELPRRELPSHESYCGVRTEQCPDCGEYVMIKYRQLHLDSNHGFIRLDDDPIPVKKEAKPARPTNLPTTSNGARSIFERLGLDEPVPPPRNIAARTEVKNYNHGQQASSSNQASSSQASTSNPRPQTNGTKKRSNDQPQININSHTANKNVDKHLGVSLGAVKKRPAPAPPRDPRRERALHSALLRQQREHREREEQNRYNAQHGLPPVLSPAAKLDKLRKMDALHNREFEDDYRKANRRKIERNAANEEERRRNEFKNVKPMSPEQFLARFEQLSVAPPVPPASASASAPPPAPALAPGQPNDRFREIKSSLRELRRGLNEVTAPYNINNNNNCNNNERGRVPSPAEELLPCEFCEMLLPPQDLVQHQTGCRPDLAQFVPRHSTNRSASRSASRSPRRSPHRSPRCSPPLDGPVIPCEFCAQSLPVYLISEHQEQCAREVN